MNIFRVAFILSLLLSSTFTYGQNVQDSTLQNIESVIESYISTVGLSEFIRAEGCKQGPKKMVCSVAIVEQEGNLNGEQIWGSISDSYSTKDIISLEKRLFVLAARESSTSLVLKVSNGKSFNGYIFDKDGDLTSMGFGSRSVTNEIKDSTFLDPSMLENVINHSFFNTSCKKESSYEVYDHLRNKIISYYKRKNIAPLFRSLYNPMHFEISGVKSEVLGESFFDVFSAYEKVNITIQLDLVGDELKIGTSIDARLASGLYKPSSSNSYWHMDEEYEEDVRTYIETFTRSQVVGWLRD